MVHGRAHLRRPPGTRDSDRRLTVTSEGGPPTAARPPAYAEPPDSSRMSSARDATAQGRGGGAPTGPPAPARRSLPHARRLTPDARRPTLTRDTSRPTLTPNDSRLTPHARRPTLTPDASR
ncbi:hypothetical protein GCM10010478_04300 [Streptomyces erythrogriseus]|uniref:Uncharacterized protein n=1 Tax=Streptomyces erythrogriseus TaxID=284027 RepID=A0ABN3WCR2_9ACTN